MRQKQPAAGPLGPVRLSRAAAAALAAASVPLSLARLGDAPTSDQVVADLLHSRFEAAERIARSFADFYQQLYRGRAGQVSDEEGGYQALKLDWELSALASNRKQVFMLGQRGRRGVMLAMGPQSSPKVVVDDAGITDASLFLHGTQLLQATRRELRVSRAGGPFRGLAIHRPCRLRCTTR